MDIARVILTVTNTNNRVEGTDIAEVAIPKCFRDPNRLCNLIRDLHRLDTVWVRRVSNAQSVIAQCSYSQSALYRESLRNSHHPACAADSANELSVLPLSPSATYKKWKTLDPPELDIPVRSIPHQSMMSLEDALWTPSLRLTILEIQRVCPGYLDGRSGHDLFHDCASGREFVYLALYQDLLIGRPVRGQ